MTDSNLLNWCNKSKHWISFFFPWTCKFSNCLSECMNMSKWKRAFVALIYVSTLRLPCNLNVTCSGLSPGGTHAYSSEAQPESSSEMECLWKSDTSFVIIFSSWPGTERTACSSRTHLQCTQIFLWRQGQLWASPLGTSYWFPQQATATQMSDLSIHINSIHLINQRWDFLVLQVLRCKLQH